MDLSTNYLTLPLKNPLIAGASPLGARLDSALRLEEAGVAAITLHSLFEEQIELERNAQWHQIAAFEESFGEALNFLPRREEFDLTPHQYLDHLSCLAEALEIPVIASLNGTTLGGWVEYASLLEDAGADALELNYYDLPTNPLISGHEVELTALEILNAIRKTVTIPISIKLSPFFIALPHFARRLVDFGVNGIVLFNRFYQPEIVLDDLEVRPQLHLSDPGELNLRLRWLAILSPQIPTSFAITGGVHTAEDVLKSVMVGASAVQMVSALLKNGPAQVSQVLAGVEEWLRDHQYDSLQQLRGCLNLATTPDPSGYERANYMRILQSWKT